MTLECELVKDVDLVCELETGGAEAKTQSKTVTPTASPQTVYPDSGYYLSSVNLTEPLSQSKTVASAVNQQTVLPDEGYLISSVTVDGMPTETASVTPTEQTQTVTPSEGKLLSEVTVNPIPSQYIVPSGELNVTENVSGVDIKQYASLNVDVPVPVMPDEYAIGGSIADNTATGYYVSRNATEINQNAFRYHTNLESVDLPNGITIIGISAFFNMKKINFVRLPSSVTEIRAQAFQYCTNLVLSDGLPSGLTTLGDSSFRDNRNLNFKELPLSLTTIGVGAFGGCPNLELEKLSPLNAIPVSAFTSCNKLKISEIPSTVASIGENAFYQNYGIAHITFKGTPNTIASNAFAQCTNLLDIYVPWSEGAVANAPWGATNATIHYNSVV